MAIIESCRYCTAPKRHPGCHGTCHDYLEQRAEYDRRKEQINKEKAVTYGIYHQRSIAVKKALKRKKGGYTHAERF